MAYSASPKKTSFGPTSSIDAMVRLKTWISLAFRPSSLLGGSHPLTLVTPPSSDTVPEDFEPFRRQLLQGRA